MTDVTIRGIDDETYAQFAAEAKKRGLAIGELATIAMRSVIEDSSQPSFKIGDLEGLSVSKTDLESLEAPVTLDNIELLDFDETVDWSTFKKHVKEIKNIELLRLPRTLSKFQVLTRCKNVEVIVSSK
jgi:hypothetical protein